MLTLDPTDITLDAPYAVSLNSLISGGLSQIRVQADNDIDVTALTSATGACTLAATGPYSTALV